MVFQANAPLTAEQKTQLEPIKASVREMLVDNSKLYSSGSYTNGTWGTDIAREMLTIARQSSPPRRCSELPATVSTLATRTPAGATARNNRRCSHPPSIY